MVDFIVLLLCSWLPWLSSPSTSESWLKRRIKLVDWTTQRVQSSPKLIANSIFNMNSYDLHRNQAMAFLPPQSLLFHIRHCSSIQFFHSSTTLNEQNKRIMSATTTTTNNNNKPNKRDKHHPIRQHVTREMRQISSEPCQTPQIAYKFVSIDEECNKHEKDTPSSLLRGSPSSDLKRNGDDPESFRLLSQFYDELMMTAFPLEEERDDLDDWFLCFRDQVEERAQQSESGKSSCFPGPAMDVVIMVLDRTEGKDDDGKDEDEFKPTIIGGAAIEYYKQARVGLLSYIVLSDKYRGCGLSKMLHEEAMRKLDILSCNYCKNGNDKGTTPTLRAVFAETNTPAAGDVSPEQSLIRHNALYNLGYRLVRFPYAQPPLTTEDLNGSFDEIVLLVYFPFRRVDVEGFLAKESLNEASDYDFNEKIDLLKRYCPWFHQTANAKCNNFDTVQMDVNIPFRYVEDFYQSVFGYESDAGNAKDNGDFGIPDYRTADYYRLAYWFTHNRVSQNENNEDVVVTVPVSVLSPPWDDCKDSLTSEWKDWEPSK